MNKKEKVYLFLQNQATVPLLFDEIALMLGVPSSERSYLKDILEELTKSGRLICHRGRYQIATLPSIDKVFSDILSAHDFSVDFPRNVEKSANQLPTSVAYVSSREDMTDLLTFTIDGADAKDFDDAISIEKKDGFYRLYVHIADVTHYVKNNDAIDKEAYKRGTSCYLPDRVAPMLPTRLSNGICSLNPGENRFAVTTIMDIDYSGDVIAFKICESMICSDYRLIYDDVSEMLEKNMCPDNAEQLFDAIKTLAALCSIIRKRRKNAGYLDFNFPEPVPFIDKNGHVVRFSAMKDGVANHMIEDCMVLCNEVIATYMVEKNIPFVYRIHEKPDAEKTQKLADTLKTIGIFIDGKMTNKNAVSILNDAKGTEKERLIHTLLLRAMMKAKYSAENLGHFGLALQNYCHFTSPIRRYPDLLCHRILKACIHGEDTTLYAKKTRRAALESSEREEAATEAEREATRYCACIYMSTRIGESFDATISSVTDFGFFVELSNMIEGLVPVSSLTQDYFIFDEKSLTLTGKDTGKVYRLGDTVRVTLSSVDCMRMRIDFAIKNEE